MEQYSFPFPGRELARKELSYDSCYEKIPEADREKIAAEAWEKGWQAAELTFEHFSQEQDFRRIVQKSGLACEEIQVDYVVGNQRYFSDYLSGKNIIHLYMKSIALWAEENRLSQEEAVNLILSHEYFHFLEWNKLGLTSRDYQVPAIRLGSIRIGKVGIRALSEIGAHGFARRYYELSMGVRQ